jgi:nitrite reductase/ring-hydroxylating ferredoxin subunit
MTYRYPFSAYPVGWYQVAWSGEVAPGEVVPLHYFGRDLVLYRTRGGEAVVLDAHCPHLGAHLGHGGRVEEDTIVCPFHAWRYGKDGRCVEARFSQRDRAPDAAVFSWPVREVSGLVMVYYHPAGERPRFELPTVAEYGAPGWLGYETYRYEVRMHVQELAENVPDAVHFNYVHGVGATPTVEHALDGPIYRQITRVPEHDGAGGGHEFRQAVYGLGLIVLHAGGPVPQVQVVAPTPIDEERVDFRASLLFYEGGGATELSEIGRGMARMMDDQFKVDIRIWENKVYRDAPPLVEEDSSLIALRRWARQFYPEDRTGA